MTINFTLDKRVREDIEPLTLKIEYREGIPLVNVAQLMRLFKLETLSIVDNSLSEDYTHEVLLIDKHRSKGVNCDYVNVFPLLLHLPISVIIEKSVNLTEKDIDFLKKLLDETIKEKNKIC
jgi:hypothetical protein|nr:MAG TPA: hypothetical protein [Caudoviricetes sp.]DAX18301.1 MAG TPA: hypothetical protein [Caudoviricetes sp.]